MGVLVTVGARVTDADLRNLGGTSETVPQTKRSKTALWTRSRARADTRSGPVTAVAEDQPSSVGSTIRP
jgi:hypothetical protein